jgi:hypothetical protein
MKITILSVKLRVLRGKKFFMNQNLFVRFQLLYFFFPMFFQ